MLADRNNIHQLACTKKCYQHAQKESSGEGRRAWDTDTPTREYTNSSEAMLIDWLLVHGNYSKWKGNNSGISKREIQKDIADVINKKGMEMGIQRERTPDQIGAKIAWCETKFRETKQWIENTGQGIREEMGEESFQQKVEKERFRHYFALLPIMSDRACMGASITTDLLETSDNNNASALFDGTDDEIQVLTPLEQNTVQNNHVEELEETSVRSEADCVDLQETEEQSIRSASASRASKTSDRKKPPGTSASIRRMEIESIDTVLESLNTTRKIEREERDKVLQEQIRHNRAMESIERKKARVSVYDSIDKSMTLFLSSQKVYNQLKGTMSLKQIAQAMPSCIKCFDFASMSASDRKKFASCYNN